VIFESVQITASLTFAREHGLQVINGGFQAIHFADLRVGLIRVGAPHESALVEPSVTVFPTGTHLQSFDSDDAIPVNSLLWYNRWEFISLQDRTQGLSVGHLRVATCRYMKKHGGVWKMSYRARQALVSAGEIAIPPDAWPQEPNAFDRLKFGMSMEEAAGVIGLGECISFYVLGATFKVRLNIDTIDVVGRLDFCSDRLVGVSGEFDMAGWETVKAIFVGRYGSPHDRQKDRLSDGCPVEEFYWSSDWIEVGLRGLLGRGENGRFHLGPSSDRHLRRQHQ
jgi:hypothetical protein